MAGNFEKCPECDSGNLIKMGGCDSCQDCFWKYTFFIWKSTFFIWKYVMNLDILLNRGIIYITHESINRI